MKKLFLPFIATVFLCTACSHKPPQPSGSEFQINDSKYYQNKRSDNHLGSLNKVKGDSQ